METTRVDICYRPLRIAWAIHSDDREAFRDAVRFTHTLWGGRFNPIVMVDRREEAEAIVELFRADVIIPVGEPEQVNEFAKHFPHLITPFFPNTFKEMREATSAQVLDIHNALDSWRDTPEWKAIDEKGVRRFVWDDDDPLRDSLLLQYGAYPAQDSGIPYPVILSQARAVIDCRIENGAAIPIDVLEHPSLGYLARHGLRRHYTVRPGWDHAGFFVGDAANINDLVCFWNLRAADIQLQFVDPAHLNRYATVKPEYERRTLASLARFDEQHRRNLGVWSRAEIIEDALKLFDGQPLVACRVTDRFFWNGGAVRPPMMIFGEASSLGVFGQELNKPKVSFSLDDKPFCGESWFFNQVLVASVKLYGGDAQHSFDPPYVPEWNEFFARRMHFIYNRLRIEPERIGIIINVGGSLL